MSCNSFHREQKLLKTDYMTTSGEEHHPSVVQGAIGSFEVISVVGTYKIHFFFLILHTSILHHFNHSLYSGRLRGLRGSSHIFCVTTNREDPWTCVWCLLCDAKGYYESCVKPDTLSLPFSTSASVSRSSLLIAYVLLLTGGCQSSNHRLVFVAFPEVTPARGTRFPIHSC